MRSPVSRIALAAGLAALAAAAGARRAEANEPPSVPVLNNPSDTMGATTRTPVFSWQASIDPEGDPIVYEVELRDAADAVISVVGVSGTVTSFAVELENQATYAWRARAIDLPGAASEWSPPNTFVVVAAVDDPEVVVNDGGCSAGRAPGPGALLVIGGALVARRRRGRRR